MVMLGVGERMSDGWGAGFERLGEKRVGSKERRRPAIPEVRER